MRRPRRHRGLLLYGALVVVSGLGVLWYARRHPGKTATALIVAWLLPGVPPPGPFG
jgi:hypothetical protein